jgi:4-hydroxybenzoate polyprenyltransferase
MVAARTSAMAFNRWADADLDAANPRTRTRAIPAGLLSRQFVFGFTCVAALIFVLAAAELNRLTLSLSPLVLIVLLGYSYLKRITRWSHLGLGLALGLAPSAAWIAVRGSLDPRILVLTAAVTLWAGGFDVLYACQDFEHDRSVGLHSLPGSVGIAGAFFAARAMQARLAVSFSCTRLARHPRRRSAAGLGALPGIAARPAPPERRLLHHERRHRHRLSGLRRRRPLAQELIDPHALVYISGAWGKTHLPRCGMVRESTRFKPRGQ